MVVTFVTPLVRTASASAPSIFTSISKALGSLFKNKGVQVGVGLTATGGGLLVLNESAKQVTNPLGLEGSSTLLVIGIVIVVLMLVLKR